MRMMDMIGKTHDEMVFIYTGNLIKKDIEKARDRIEKLGNIKNCPLKWKIKYNKKGKTYVERYGFHSKQFVFEKGTIIAEAKGINKRTLKGIYLYLIGNTCHLTITIWDDNEPLSFHYYFKYTGFIKAFIYTRKWLEAFGIKQIYLDNRI